MDRRSFLKLSTIFSLGALIAPKVKSILDNINSFIDPVYIYKIKHQMGQIRYFASSFSDLRDVSTNPELEELEENYFEMGSLELISIKEKTEAKEELRKLKTSEEVLESVYGQETVSSYDKKYGKLYFPLRVVSGKHYSLNFYNTDQLNDHYSRSIAHYYKKRENKEYYNLSIEYCKKHIEIAQDIYNLQVERNRTKVLKYISKGNEFTEDIEKIIYTNYKTPKGKWLSYIPGHHGYYQLAIILEEEKKYEEGIELCKNAMNIGFDGTWEKRINRMTKKMKKENSILV